MSILLVEDDRDLATPWFEYLRAKGHHTEVRHTVAEARRVLLTDPPDLLIVDYTLPDGTAADVLQIVAADEASRTKVIVCSGHGHDLPGITLGSGATVLAKPFRLDQLDATIFALLG